MFSPQFHFKGSNVASNSGTIIKNYNFNNIYSKSAFTWLYFDTIFLNFCCDFKNAYFVGPKTSLREPSPFPERKGLGMFCYET